MKDNDEMMKLPEGKYCVDCRHFKRCSRLVGAEPDWGSCDFYPRRFVDEAE